MKGVRYGVGAHSLFVGANGRLTYQSQKVVGDALNAETPTDSQTRLAFIVRRLITRYGDVWPQVLAELSEHERWQLLDELKNMKQVTFDTEFAEQRERRRQDLDALLRATAIAARDRWVTNQLQGKRKRK
jgi:hypothetical protein